jgi:hypothetical protein
MTKESDKISVDVCATNNDNKHYAKLFQEDLIRSINRYSSKYKDVICKLERENDEFENILKELLPNYRGIYTNQLKDEFFEAGEKIMAHLIKNGYALFELVRQIDLNNKEKFKLIDFHSNTFKFENENFIQSFQDENQKNIEIRIKKEKCLIIDFPDILGNTNEYFNFIDKLDSEGNSLPKMYLGDQTLFKTKGYDFEEHKKLIEIQKLILYKKYSWTERRFKDDLLTAFNNTKMQLEFKKLQIQLRDYVFNLLIDYIEKFSIMLGCPNKIIIEGMLSVKDVEDAIKKWEIGEITKSEISAILY